MAKEDYNYGIRGVAQRQVYDSYMGILRISPNYGEDDPTDLLNTPGEIIKLSDSDGNFLPIKFMPKEFTDYINISTNVDDNVYATQTLTVRSTLLLTDETSDTKSRILIFNGLSDKTTNGILMYPTERPSSGDSDYFLLNINLNEKNKFWTEENKKWVTDGERYKLVEKELLEKKLDWYDTNVEKDEKVQIDDTYLTQTNNYGEEVPILYTHDYILGTSKEGTTTNKLPENFEDLDDFKKLYGYKHIDGLNGKCTQLSWERIDKIIWDNLDTYLNYRDDKDDRFSVTSILSNNPTYQTDSKTLSNDRTGWRANAPLLARGVQDGLIMYHAMPFNRYWFHRCRQVLTNMEISGSNWLDINTYEKNELNTAKSNKLITAASKATLTPHHSLAKDYLLCNGKEVNVTNFPNINLKNDKFFNISQKGAYANQTGNKYNVRTQVSGTTHYAVFNSLSKKLPDLFNFKNLSPRFIRGLNFSFNEGKSYIISDVVKFGEAPQNRVNTLYSSSNQIMGYCKTPELTQNKDIFGESSKFFKKEITDVSRLYNSSYDYLDKKWKHYHLLFAENTSDRDKVNEKIIAETLKSNEGQYARQITTDDKKASNWTTEIPDPNSLNWPTTIEGIRQMLAGKWGKSDNNSIRTIDCTSDDEIVLFDNTKCKTLPDSWLGYCFKPTAETKKGEEGQSNLSFAGFYPIPTAGLLYLSTLDETENVKTTYFRYFDAEGKSHKFPEDVKNNPDKLKQFKIKLNESEGIWPISMAGKASFTMKHNHTWRRKRTSTFKKRWDWEHGILIKKDVGKYFLNGTDLNGDMDVKTIQFNDRYIWRSMTSLPLTNCDKLACGDLLSFNNNKFKNKEKISPKDPDFYTYHNVTDQWRKSTKKFEDTLSYGGKTIDTTDDSPYPSHINLLPLIKL